MDTEKLINDYYESHDEDSRFALKSGRVEFSVTMRYIEKYLKKGDRVAEIGAGTGAYSHALARKGYEVDAVELVEHNIDIFKKNTQKGEKITIKRGNALDLSPLKGEYDITLLLGPMYHLYTFEEQRRALCEAIRITKPSGKIFVSYCGSDATAVQFLFGKHNSQKEQYVALIDRETFKLGSTPEEIFALHRREDIDELIRGLPLTRLNFVGTDMLTRYISQAVNEMEDEEFGLYIKYVLATCEREDLSGASNHFLDILQKTE